MNEIALAINLQRDVEIVIFIKIILCVVLKVAENEN